MEEEKEKRYAPWIMPDTMNFPKEIKKRLVTIALRIVLTMVMKNHVYVFNNELRKQRNGRAIGLELTGLLARIYMIWWDKQFLEKCAQNGILLKIYKRYVDDINLLLKYIGTGYKYNGSHIIRDPEREEIDRNKEADEIMMKLVKEIAIHPSIPINTHQTMKIIKYPFSN